MVIIYDGYYVQQAPMAKLMVGSFCQLCLMLLSSPNNSIVILALVHKPTVQHCGMRAACPMKCSSA